MIILAGYDFTYTPVRYVMTSLRSLAKTRLQVYIFLLRYVVAPFGLKLCNPIQKKFPLVWMAGGSFFRFPLFIPACRIVI